MFVIRNKKGLPMCHLGLFIGVGIAAAAVATATGFWRLITVVARRA